MWRQTNPHNWSVILPLWRIPWGDAHSGDVRRGPGCESIVVARRGALDMNELLLSIVSDLGGPTDPLFLVVCGSALAVFGVVVKLLLQGR